MYHVMPVGTCRSIHSYDSYLKSDTVCRARRIGGFEPNPVQYPPTRHKTDGEPVWVCAIWSLFWRSRRPASFASRNNQNASYNSSDAYCQCHGHQQRQRRWNGRVARSSSLCIFQGNGDGSLFVRITGRPYHPVVKGHSLNFRSRKSDSLSLVHPPRLGRYPKNLYS